LSVESLGREEALGLSARRSEEGVYTGLGFRGFGAITFWAD
jgi:hypothetical protein